MIWTKQDVLNYLEKDKEGDIYECSKKQKKTARTLAQNKYYFWIIVPTIADFHWYYTIEVHELIKGMFKLETTTWLSTEEFIWLIKQIREIWQTKYNCYIPEPEDRYLFK